jgi:hypothetical protein
MCYYIYIKASARTPGYTIGLDGMIPSSSNGTKPTFGCKLWVGFYFLLLIIAMYAKRATTKIANEIMMSIASLSSMASPPFEGKPRPPKIQLYLSILPH